MLPQKNLTPIEIGRKRYEMGFMDKLGATLATKYGEVTEGKHKGCIVALGNPPEQKVSTTDKFTQIIFLENKETMGRYNIGSEAKTLHFVKNDHDSATVIIDFADGESCTILLSTPKEDSGVASILKKNFGLKSATKVNADGSTETNSAVKYRNIMVFLLSFRETFSDEDTEKVYTCLKGYGLIEDK